MLKSARNCSTIAKGNSKLNGYITATSVAELMLLLSVFLSAFS